MTEEVAVQEQEQMLSSKPVEIGEYWTVSGLGVVLVLDRLDQEMFVIGYQDAHVTRFTVKGSSALKDKVVIPKQLVMLREFTNHARAVQTINPTPIPTERRKA